MLKYDLCCIEGLYEDAMHSAKNKLDILTKPLGSLGKLEEIVQRIAGITGNSEPVIDKKAIIIMCADNGVVEEGVSSCPKSVTATVTKNFTRGITGVNVFSRLSKADIVIVDIGVDDDIKNPMIINRKIRKNTWNIVKGPAMEKHEAEQAINTGIEIVRQQKEQGVKLLGTGEMGIGNTTTSSAVSSVLLGHSPEDMIGIGSGLSKDALINKVEVVKRAIEFNKPYAQDPIDVLAKVGGFDIAGLTGCFIGAAMYRIPIIIDGFISAAAALTAVKLNPHVKDFIFTSHGSAEPGNRLIMKALGMEPMLNLNMRLGEGTGAALAFQLFDAAFAAYYQMGTFDDAQIEQYVPQD